MCFSAEASFSASVVLGVIGVASLLKVKKKQHYFLALIPLFFAIQQFCEGWVWVGLNKGEVNHSAVWAFLFFAILWPFWVPISIYMAEKKKSVKQILFYFILLGVGVVGTLIMGLILYPVDPKIVNCSVQYSPDKLPYQLLYLGSVLIPCLISSVKNLWIIGIAIGIGFFIAEYFYHSTFTSVWCFFAALISLGLYAIVTSLER